MKNHLFDEHKIRVPPGESKGPQEKRADEIEARKKGQPPPAMTPKQKSIQQALGLNATKDRERDIANWYIERFAKHGGFLGRCGVGPAKDYPDTVVGQFRL